MPDLLAALERERPGQYQEEVPSAPRIETLTEQVVVETVRKPRQVFVSHAHEDTELAHRLASDLEANGLGV